MHKINHRGVRRNTTVRASNFIGLSQYLFLLFLIHNVIQQEPIANRLSLVDSRLSMDKRKRKFHMLLFSSIRTSPQNTKLFKCGQLVRNVGPENAYVSFIKELYGTKKRTGLWERWRMANWSFRKESFTPTSFISHTPGL